MYYIYKITNLINNKIYIGYHYSDDIENDKYLGSGDLIMYAVRHYGKNNFKRDILFEFDNSVDAFNKERELVNDDFIKRRDTYNTKIGGQGWNIGSEPHNKGKLTIYSPITNKNYYVSENELQKYLDDGYILGNKSKNNKNCIGKDNEIKYVDNESLTYYLENGWKRTNSTENKICITHIETKKLKYVNSSEIDIYLENGYVIGNLKSGVNKGKIYISKDGKNKRINQDELLQYLDLGWIQKRVQKELNIRRMYNPNTNELKNIDVNQINDYLVNGWKIGVNYIGVANTIYINKDGKHKRINPNKIQQYLDDGWVRGMDKKR